MFSFDSYAGRVASAPVNNREAVNWHSHGAEALSDSVSERNAIVAELDAVALWIRRLVYIGTKVSRYNGFSTQSASVPMQRFSFISHYMPLSNDIGITSPEYSCQF